MPRPDLPPRVDVVFEGGSLDGHATTVGIPRGHEAEAWAELRRVGVTIRRLPGGGVEHTSPGGPGYYPTDRTDGAGRPILGWRNDPLVR